MHGIQRQAIHIGITLVAIVACTALAALQAKFLYFGLELVVFATGAVGGVINKGYHDLSFPCLQRQVA